MRHLCSFCSSLQLGKRKTSEDMRVFEWTNSSPTVSYLIESAAGTANGKPCHFCAILLRSLKSHSYVGTEDEQASLPKGQITLCLSAEKDDDLAIIADCDGSSGHPIKLSLGAGQYYHRLRISWVLRKQLIELISCDDHRRILSRL